jgi:hypothetical protein
MEMDAALIATTVISVQLLTVRTPILVVPPMAAVAVIFPVPAVRVKFWMPDVVAFTVLVKEIPPDPALELSVKLEIIVIGPANEIPPSAMIVSPILTAPVPD